MSDLAPESGTPGPSSAVRGDLAGGTAVFALALAFVYAVTTRLGGSRLAGAGAAVALAFSHTFWHYSVITGVRSLNALFLALLLWLLIRWRSQGSEAAGLVLPAAFFLLGMTNHLVLFLALPGLVFFAVTTRPDLVRRRRTLGSWAASPPSVSRCSCCPPGHGGR